MFFEPGENLVVGNLVDEPIAAARDPPVDARWQGVITPGELRHVAFREVAEQDAVLLGTGGTDAKAAVAIAVLVVISGLRLDRRIAVVTSKPRSGARSGDWLPE